MNPRIKLRLRETVDEIFAIAFGTLKDGYELDRPYGLAINEAMASLRKLIEEINVDKAFADGYKAGYESK